MSWKEEGKRVDRIGEGLRQDTEVNRDHSVLYMSMKLFKLKKKIRDHNDICLYLHLCESFSVYMYICLE